MIGQESMGRCCLLEQKPDRNPDPTSVLMVVVVVVEEPGRKPAPTGLHRLRRWALHLLHRLPRPLSLLTVVVEGARDNS